MARSSQRPKRALLVAVILGVGLAVTGVALVGAADDGGGNIPAGASATPAAPSEEFDGCEVVTRDDAREILGGTPKEGPSSPEQFTTASCIWEVMGSGSSLQFSAYRGRELYGGEVLADDPGFDEVDGIGDGAFFSEAAGVQLQFLVGDYTAVISVSGIDDERRVEKERIKRQLGRLGKRVASKLLD